MPSVSNWGGADGGGGAGFLSDTCVDHTLEYYTSMRHIHKDDKEDYNMEGITHGDHNFASLRGSVVSRTRDATMGDWMMGASKVGICVCMVTHT